MKLISIVGARPQFIKLSPLVRALREHPTPIEHIIINTGQHYDHNMSQVFFDTLNIPTPMYNLSVGSGSHSKQTGIALEKLEPILKNECPDKVIIFGDTNATLSGALAASKLNIPISHIEAGLRSNNLDMPEEINRIIADKLSSQLFCPNATSVNNLQKENCRGQIYCVGDIMADQIDYTNDRLNNALPLYDDPFIYMTLHRQEITKKTDYIKTILITIDQLLGEKYCIFPVHPRIKNTINDLKKDLSDQFKFIDPIDHLKSIAHIKQSLFVITDSGGMQKEAYLLKKPCITVRNETEWEETLIHKWNTLVGFDTDKIISAFNRCLSFPINTEHLPVYGVGDTAKLITEALIYD